MAIFVKFWGTRGLIPTPGNSTRVYGSNTPCVEVRSDDTIFVCDAGSGLRDFGKDFLARESRPKEIHIGITHLHWDHVQGLPFAPIYFHGTKLRVYGQGAADGTLQKILAGRSGLEAVPALQNGDGIVFEELGNGADFGGLRVRTTRLEHPGGCYGFIFEKEGKKVVYAPDNELPIQNGDKSSDAKKGSLSRVPPSLMEPVRGADLLILDAQYDEQQYAARKGWGHSTCFSAVDLAVAGKVKNLALFHHDPESTDHDLDARVQSCYERAGVGDLTIFAAREGVELKF